MFIDAGLAHAQTSRIYFAGYLGLHKTNDLEFSESATPGTGDLETDNATTFAGALGMRLNRQVRLEAELGYRNTEFKAMDVAGTGSFGAGGELESTLALVNLYYDFDVPWQVQPYVGGGIGYGWHSGEINSGAGSGLTNASGSDSNVLWNAAAGIKYRPRRDFAFTAGYRYLDSLDLNIGNYEMDYGGHEFRLGVEWDLPVR